MHARAYYRVADKLAGLVVADDARLVAIAGDCAASGPPSTECIDAFLDDFGLRVLRRPLTTDERAVYQTLASTAPDGTEAFRGVIFSLLMTPQFLYHVEVDGDGRRRAVRARAYALAARLSFHFWQSMPDAELFAAAEDGSLADRRRLRGPARPRVCRPPHAGRPSIASTTSG